MQTEIGKITSKGQTTIPSALRKSMNLSTGDEVLFGYDGEVITIRKVTPLDRQYYKALQATFASEWDSPDDQEIFDEL